MQEIKVRADELSLSDTVLETITNGHSARIQVETLTFDGKGDALVTMSGYRTIVAGVCGPAERTYRRDELLTVEREEASR